jgi:hypothetical protein
MYVTQFLMHSFEHLAEGGWRTRDAHLALAFARRDDVDGVTLVDRPASLPEVGLGRRWGAGRLEAWAARDEHLAGASKLSVLRLSSHRFVQPLVQNRGWWGEAYRPDNLTDASRSAINARLANTDLVVTHVPTSWPLWAGHPRAHLDTLDNWMNHPAFADQIRGLRGHYEASIAASSSISAISVGTQQAVAALGGISRLVPNGVDADALEEHARATHDEWQAELRGLPRPWLLYVGKMQQRILVPMLAELAAATKGTILLAGPVFDPAHLAPLRQLGNVRFLGDVHYDRMGGLVTVADVALIPHDPEQDFDGDPLKAYEYGALGARIVATKLPNASGMPSTAIQTAPEGFVEACLSLGTDSRSLGERLAAAHRPAAISWDQRAADLLDAAMRTGDLRT